jgi:hypothetical protein
MRLIKIHFAESSLDLISEEIDYDKEKYREMLVLIGESTGIVFVRNRNWWYELREERRKDIQAERNVHDG